MQWTHTVNDTVNLAVCFMNLAPYISLYILSFRVYSAREREREREEEEEDGKETWHKIEETQSLLGLSLSLSLSLSFSHSL